MGQTGVSQGDFNWEGKDQDAIMPFSYLNINHDLLELLGIEMKEGRTFSREFSADTAKIIFNEAAIAVMGLSDPVGKIFSLWGNEMEIIGVTKNFHFRSFHENIKPIFFRLLPNNAVKVMVKIQTGTERETIEELQNFYQTYNPGYTFDYQFLDQEYQAQYAAEQRVSTLSRYFAGIAILISCLGLFGLAAFTAERRYKEIGIRKVLGATTLQILNHISLGFLKIIGIAALVAVPFAWIGMNSWLGTFPYRINLSPGYFLFSITTLLIGALLVILVQSLKSSNANPADTLKEE